MITGKFSVTTAAEVRALAKLGVSPENPLYRCEAVTRSDGFYTVDRERRFVFGSFITVVGFRERGGAAQFYGLFHGTQAWVTSEDGSWNLTFESTSTVR